MSKGPRLWSVRFPLALLCFLTSGANDLSVCSPCRSVSVLLVCLKLQDAGRWLCCHGDSWVQRKRQERKVAPPPHHRARPAPPSLFSLTHSHLPRPPTNKHKHTPVAMMTTLWIIDRPGLLYITVYRENSISEQIAPTTLCCNTFSGSAPTAASSLPEKHCELAPVHFLKVWTLPVVTFPEQTVEKKRKHLMMLLYIEGRAAVLRQFLSYFFNKHFDFFFLFSLTSASVCSHTWMLWGQRCTSFASESAVRQKPSPLHTPPPPVNKTDPDNEKWPGD